MRLALAAVLFAVAAPLAAQPDEDRALFRNLDTNHDGFLSPQELAAPAATQRNWIAVDRNGDKRIAPDEFGIVRNFASQPPGAAAGATRAPQQQQQQPKASGRP